MDSVWGDTAGWFRDGDQLLRVVNVIVDRLADDRVAAECRQLMRLKEHLCATESNISYGQLKRDVSAAKMQLLDRLFALVVVPDFEGIDGWIADAEQELPVVVDRWMTANDDFRKYILDEESG